MGTASWSDSSLIWATMPVCLTEVVPFSALMWSFHNFSNWFVRSRESSLAKLFFIHSLASSLILFSMMRPQKSTTGFLVSSGNRQCNEGWTLWPNCSSTISFPRLCMHVWDFSDILATWLKSSSLIFSQSLLEQSNAKLAVMSCMTILLWWGITSFRNLQTKLLLTLLVTVSTASLMEADWLWKKLATKASCMFSLLFALLLVFIFPPAALPSVFGASLWAVAFAVFIIISLESLDLPILSAQIDPLFALNPDWNWHKITFNSLTKGQHW